MMSEPPSQLAEEQKSNMEDIKSVKRLIDSNSASKTSHREMLSNIQEALDNTPPTVEGNCSDKVPKHR